LFTAISFRDAAQLVFNNFSAHELEPYGSPDGFVLVAPSHGAVNVYVFLIGLALENLIKAEYFRLHPGSILGGKLPSGVTNHKLSKLAKHIGLELSPQETQLLEIATEALTSWGRYPGGVRHNEGDVGPPANFNPASFRHSFESFFERLQYDIAQDIEGLE
jgi:hypothetical protein